MSNVWTHRCIKVLCCRSLYETRFCSSSVPINVSSPLLYGCAGRAPPTGRSSRCTLQWCPTTTSPAPPETICSPGSFQVRSAPPPSTTGPGRTGSRVRPHVDRLDLTASLCRFDHFPLNHLCLFLWHVNKETDVQHIQQSPVQQAV